VIRAAKLQDIPRLVDLGELMHAESPNYRDIPFSREKVATTLTHLVTRDGVVFVSERGGVVVGGIAGGTTEYWFSLEKFGFEYAFFLTPEARHGITAVRLQRTFKEWCKLQGVKRFIMGTSTGIATTGTTEFFEALGMELTGHVYTGEAQ
jgi:hypothetical protein